jgi:hypothetical protein
MVFGFHFSLIALIGIILLIGIVEKNGIMLVDFAIGALRNRARRRDPRGMSTALSADHHDDDGRAPRRCPANTRRGHRRGDPPAAWLRHRWRADRQPGADALYDADRLPIP